MHEPNEVHSALDVTSAVNMNIEFKHPHIVVTVPPEKAARRRNGKMWYHIINHSNQKYTTETSALDDFTSLLVGLFAPLLLSFLAMPGLCCFSV